MTDPRTLVIPAGTPVRINYHKHNDRETFLDYPHFFEPKDLQYIEIFKTWTVINVSKSVYGYEVDPKYILNRELMEVA